MAVGSYSAEVEGPHGLAVDPDGRHWNVSISHGFLWGSVRKYETGSDAWAGAVTLGPFTATLDVSAATGLLFAVNFNLHGRLEPGSISVVETDTMTEVARVDTGADPGTVEVNRLATGERVAAVDVGKQTGGIAFWKMED